MITITPSFRAALAGLYLLVLGLPAFGQVPGAVERFTDQAVAAGWRVFDYKDGQFYVPSWVDGADPHIEYPYTGDSAIWFLAGTTVSGGKLTGDLSSGVAGLAVDIRVDDITQLAWVDLIIASASGGQYFQSAFLDANDIGGNGWTTVTASFAETWFYVDTNGTFQAANLTEGALDDVSEVGLRMGPKTGNTISSLIGADNFRLVPVLVPPVLNRTPSTPPEFTFEMLPGHAYAVEEAESVTGWQSLPGYTNLTGTGTSSFPLGTNEVARTYRLAATPHYHE